MKHGDKIKKEILHQGCMIWAEDVSKLSARAIGKRMGGYTHSAILYHFGTFEKLKNAIAEYAVETGFEAVIRQLKAVDHPALNLLKRATPR